MSYIVCLKLEKMFCASEKEIFNKISYCVYYLSDTSYWVCYKIFYGDTHLK